MSTLAVVMMLALSHYSTSTSSDVTNFFIIAGCMVLCGIAVGVIAHDSKRRFKWLIAAPAYAILLWIVVSAHASVGKTLEVTYDSQNIYASIIFTVSQLGPVWWLYTKRAQF